MRSVLGPGWGSLRVLVLVLDLVMDLVMELVLELVLGLVIELLLRYNGSYGRLTGFSLNIP